jgi:hypothetical protein
MGGASSLIYEAREKSEYDIIVRPRRQSATRSGGGLVLRQGLNHAADRVRVLDVLMRVLDVHAPGPPNVTRFRRAAAAGRARRIDSCKVQARTFS